MALELGLALFPGQPLGKSPDTYLTDLDIVVGALGGALRGLWMTDHFFWGEEPCHEAWTTMSFIAALYPQQVIGAAVLGQSYRNPALTAKMAATLHVLSGGRLIMGIGAGWKEDEYRAFNYEYPSPGVRIEQLEDTIEIMRRLWTQPDPITYVGTHHQVTDARCQPKPGAIPLMIGGGGDKTMRLAARFGDWWNIPDAPVTVYAEKVARLRQHCADVGRDYATLRKTWFGRLVVAETDAAAIERGGRWTPANAICGSPDSVIAQFRAFAEQGCDYFIVEIADQTDAAVHGLLLSEVLPALKAIDPA